MKETIWVDSKKEKEKKRNDLNLMRWGTMDSIVLAHSSGSITSEKEIYLT